MKKGIKNNGLVLTKRQKLSLQGITHNRTFVASKKQKHNEQLKNGLTNKTLIFTTNKTLIDNQAKH